MSVHQNNSIKLSASRTPLPREYCRRFQDEEYHTVNFLVTLVSILLYAIFRALSASSVLSLVLQFMVVLNLLIAVYCHISLCFISRRHEKQIRSEQIPGEAAAKFHEEKKAWKTTAIIIGCGFFCLLPGLLI